jgi:hypothetical protein
MHLTSEPLWTREQVAGEKDQHSQPDELGKVRKQMTRKQRTDNELQQGAAFVSYEVQMMLYAFDCWKSTSEDQETKNDRRVYNEAFLVHVRNVLDFLYLRGNVEPHLRRNVERLARTDDVIAEDYPAEWKLPQGVKIGGRPVYDSKEPDDLRHQINKLLSHVTYNRTKLISNLQPERWPVEDIKNDIMGHMEDFRSQLPPDRKAWFVW